MCIPWLELVSRPVDVELNDVVISLEWPLDSLDLSDSLTGEIEGALLRSLRQSVLQCKQDRNGDSDSNSDQSQSDQDDDSDFDDDRDYSSSGIKPIEEFFDDIFSQMNVKVNNLVIVFNREGALRLKLSSRHLEVGPGDPHAFPEDHPVDDEDSSVEDPSLRKNLKKISVDQALLEIVEPVDLAGTILRCGRIENALKITKNDITGGDPRNHLHIISSLFSLGTENLDNLKTTDASSPLPAEFKGLPTSLDFCMTPDQLILLLDVISWIGEELGETYSESEAEPQDLSKSGELSMIFSPRWEPAAGHLSVSLDLTSQGASFSLGVVDSVAARRHEQRFLTTLVQNVVFSLHGHPNRSFSLKTSSLALLSILSSNDQHNCSCKTSDLICCPGCTLCNCWISQVVARTQAGAKAAGSLVQRRRISEGLGGFGFGNRTGPKELHFDFRLDPLSILLSSEGGNGLTWDPQLISQLLRSFSDGFEKQESRLRRMMHNALQTGSLQTWWGKRGQKAPDTGTTCGTTFIARFKSPLLHIKFEEIEGSHRDLSKHPPGEPYESQSVPSGLFHFALSDWEVTWNSRPIQEGSDDSVLFLEFGTLEIGDRKDFKILATADDHDPADRPRIEITLRKRANVTNNGAFDPVWGETVSPTHTDSWGSPPFEDGFSSIPQYYPASPPPAAMGDVEAVFSRPGGMSFCFGEFEEVPPQLDLEKERIHSPWVVDSVIPCLQIEGNPSLLSSESFPEKEQSIDDFGLGLPGWVWTMIGHIVLDSPPGPSLGVAMLSCGRFSCDIFSLLRVEARDLRVYRGVTTLPGFPGNDHRDDSNSDVNHGLGSFVLVQHSDLKIIDPTDGNVVLLRPAPHSLGLGEVFCPPLAMIAASLQVRLTSSPKKGFSSSEITQKSGVLILLERIALGCKSAPWIKLSKWSSRLVSDFQKRLQPSFSKQDKVPQSQDELSVDLLATALSFYFQPSPLHSITTLPPRCVLSLSALHLSTLPIQIQSHRLSLFLIHPFSTGQRNRFLDFFNLDSQYAVRDRNLVKVFDLDTLTVRKEEGGIELDFTASPGSRNPLRISLRRDSFKSFLNILSLFGSHIDKEVAVLKELLSLSDQENFPDSLESENPLRVPSLDGDQEQSQDKSSQSPSPLPAPSPSPPIREDCLFDESEDEFFLESSTIEHAQKPPPSLEGDSLKHWHWVNGPADEEVEKKRTQKENDSIFFPDVKCFEILKVLDLEVLVRFIDGADWSESNQNEGTDLKEDHSTEDFVMVACRLDSTIFLFDKNEVNDFRLSFEISQLSVFDEVTISHLQRLLSFPEDESPVLSILFEKGKTLKLKVNTAPIRLYVDQATVVFLCAFFAFEEGEIEFFTKHGPAPTFEWLDLGDIVSVVDYKPHKNTFGSVYNDIRVGNNIWAFKMVELNNSPITLSGAQLINVDSDKIMEELLSIWINNFKDKQVYNYLYGTRIGQPVQIGVNIGSAFVDLVKIPIDEYNRGGNVLLGIGAGATNLVQRVSVEVLNLGLSGAIKLKKGLTKIDKVMTGNGSGDEFHYNNHWVDSNSDEEHGHEEGRRVQHISNYADQPGTIAEGFVQGKDAVVWSISESWNAISSAGIVRGLPSAIVRTAGGTLGAVSKALLGFKNTMDSEGLEESRKKYKVGDPMHTSGGRGDDDFGSYWEDFDHSKY